MTRKIIALVLAGGKTGQYGVLTRNRAKGALTFAGHYRIIDFTLSNLKHSRIENIGLVIQYLPASLIEHVGVGQHWDLNGYGRCLKIMPPFVGVEKTEWYKGTADALYQNWNFVQDLNPELIVVLSGEHVYHLNFCEAIAFHRDNNADVTMITCELRPQQCRTRFGYVLVGDNMRVERFCEKPAVPPCTTASTGMYVFRREVLEELLAKNAQEEKHNLAKDVLEPIVHELNSFAYPMRGPWEYMENVADYFDTHMRFLRQDGFEMLRQWGIITNLEFRDVGVAPAARIGTHANVSESLVCSKCFIEGTVENSILSPGVQVQRGAVVRNSILMHDCVVEEGAVLEHVISDRDAVFGKQCRVGSAEAPAHPDPAMGRLTLVGKAARIEAGAVVEQGKEVPHRGVVPAR
ncbi:MAG: sugar phosphate nucleotidyltransferase [Candidatus Sumerlaea chitinivorans]|nr:sugar phosphate nucleotidyltransferase [Candidatus Sumerlaea chitinivorans]